jgi:hypothetical protein
LRPRRGCGSNRNLFGARWLRKNIAVEVRSRRFVSGVEPDVHQLCVEIVFHQVSTIARRRDAFSVEEHQRDIEGAPPELDAGTPKEMRAPAFEDPARSGRRAKPAPYRLRIVFGRARVLVQRYGVGHFLRRWSNRTHDAETFERALELGVNVRDRSGRYEVDSVLRAGAAPHDDHRVEDVECRFHG